MAIPPITRTTTRINAGLGTSGIVDGGITIDSRVIFDSILTPHISLLKKAAPPLALLPMRMEYRFVNAKAKPKVRNDAAFMQELETLIKASRSSQRQTREKAVKDIHMLRQKAEKNPKFEPYTKTKEELWVRWYPDSDFGRRGIAPPDEEEAAALAAFRTGVGASAWWMGGTPELSGHWQTLVAAVGPARALHLLRSDAPTRDAEPDLGRITALPSHVALFAMTSQKVEHIATGAAIPANAPARSIISYTQEALETGGWLASFEMAVKHGMGIKIADPAHIALAESADWLVAVGLNGGDVADDLNALFADSIANGSFGFLRQDMPTNNTLGERTPYRRWRDEPDTFLSVATDLERGRHNDGIDGAADILGQALGVDAMILRRAIHSGDTAFEDARAMMRVIGPALLDGALDGKTAFVGIDENAMIDIMAAYICARGALPAVMMGANPYGILPITINGSASVKDTDGFNPIEATVLERLNLLGSILVSVGAHRAKNGAAAVLNPDTPETTSEQFEKMLQNARTGQRVELINDDGEARAIACPYVRGASTDKQPVAYLGALRTTALTQLPDPDEKDRSWPLLYRLARIAMTRNVTQIMADIGVLDKAKNLREFEALPDTERVKTLNQFNAISGEFSLASGGGSSRRTGRAAPGSVAAEKAKKAQRLLSAFDRSLGQLQAVAARTNGVAELETLMMEVLDLLQHRADALLTGIAFARLQKQRAQGEKGIRGGYYAMIGKLRRANNAAGSDGYIQAPGMAQATTAALLRSAYLRHRDGGAFDIDLSSARVRKAMALLDLLAAGSPLPAVLGLRAERMVRELPGNGSYAIPILRRAFPLHNVSAHDPSKPLLRKRVRSGAPMMDGQAFLDAPTSAIPVAIRTLVSGVRTQLADDVDALSDAILAEAVHHRAMGATETANAWLQVLSGGHVPGKPVFLRTQRVLQASSHRLTLILPNAVLPANPAMASPRRSAEPALAAMADRVALAYGGPDVPITLHVTALADSARSVSLTLRSQSDLGMEPIDLMIGGQSELQVRAHYALSSKWRANDAATAALGPLTADQNVPKTASIAIDLGNGANSASALMAQLAALRTTAGQGRAMEPSDLANAADAAHGPLMMADEAAALRTAADVLTERARALANAMQPATVATQSALAVLRSRLLAWALALDTDPAGIAASSARSAALAALADLQNGLPRLAACGVPEVLSDMTVEGLLLNDAPLTVLDAALSRVTAHIADLLALTMMGGGEDAGAARAAISARIAAIQAALDGEALPIVPPYPNAAPTLTPLVDTATPLPGGLTHLADWAEARHLVNGAREAIRNVASLGISKVKSGATIAPGDLDDDVRSEAEAPRSRHYGLFIADRALDTAGDQLAGIVVDEWAENRPSAKQDAALAVNYNTPDAQAPNAILLCVAPNADWSNWTPENAATMVGAAIQQMQARALSSDNRVAQTTLSQDSNRVPYKKQATKSVKRIPERTLRFGLLDHLATTGLFIEATAVVADVGLRGSGLSSVGGFINTRK